MIGEARLEERENSLIPKSDGWFILHASEAPWVQSEQFGLKCDFEGDAPSPPPGDRDPYRD